MIHCQKKKGVATRVQREKMKEKSTCVSDLPRVDESDYLMIRATSFFMCSGIGWAQTIMAFQILYKHLRDGVNVKGGREGRALQTLRYTLSVRPVRTLFTQRAKELMSSPQGKSNIRPCPRSVPTHVICMWHWLDSSEHYSGLDISVKEHWWQILEGNVFFFKTSTFMFHNTTMYMLSIFLSRYVYIFWDFVWYSVHSSDRNYIFHYEAIFAKLNIYFN